MKKTLAIAGLLLKEIFRKKDFYVAFILMVVIVTWASGLQFYNVKNIVRYLMEIGLLLVFSLSAILSVMLSARQYRTEVSERTLATVIAKPLSRSEFVMGKFIGSFIASAACFTIYFAVFVFIAYQKAGTVSWVLATQTYYLYLLNLMVLSAMVSGLSYYLTTSANVTVSLLGWFLMNAFGAGLNGQFIYYVLPHYEFFDMRQRFIHDFNPLSIWLIGILTAYAFFYAMFFVTLGYMGFRRRFL